MKQHDLMPTFINGDRIVLKTISPNDETSKSKELAKMMLDSSLN